ncbi:porin family protein [Flavobacterium sp. NG2]|uniref:porin family protein n=1 Tax=Flavobacterium sp. NG2 TaxID=3097547 RepID=UPI002A8337CE|nr:porin family protein [Flavobacterium sp. NG2]WPR70048.1 porin family protein [Flavobacterium sp. NG2]
MKKSIVSLVVFFVFNIVNAQDIKYGVKGGTNLSIFTGDVGGNGDVKAKIGYQAGGFVNFKLNDKFSLQPELVYSTQGVERKNINVVYQGVTYSGEGKVKLDYVYLPVMMQYFILKKTFLEFGSQVGVLVSAKAETTFSGSTAETDVKDRFKSMDVGLNAGAGYQFTEQLSLGIRYNVGLTNISNLEGNYTIHNSILTLSAGYAF